MGNKLIAEQHVSRLDITVCNVLLVAVLYCGGKAKDDVFDQLTVEKAIVV